MSNSVHNAEELKRKFLFTPLETKEDLHAWIQVYLDLDIPDSIVDPDSTASPMQAIWEVYDKCRRNDDENYSRVLNYASRMSFKTLAAAILEVLMVFHLGRSVAHMAAIEAQARKSQEYVKKFLRRPLLREFVVGSNQRKVEVVRYDHLKTGRIISPKEWEALPQANKDEYEQKSYYITIVICTMQGANSEHVPFMVIDEVDVVANPEAYKEAQAIPDSFEGKMPVTVLTSTRKFNYGLVQKEIDEAHKTGLHIRHWNILDVTERCPRSRHAPDQPDVPISQLKRITIYRSDETLRGISQAEYDSLDEKQKESYVKDEGFVGCLERCKLFAICKTRLATHQKSNSKLLKKISQVQSQFASFSPDMAKAQLLCWKPSTEGLIYPRFNRDIHVITAAQIAEKVTGDEYTRTHPRMSKLDLINLLKSREVRWFSGMDFGFTHNFAVVTGFKDGSRMFIIDVISQPELDMGQMIQVCDARFKKGGMDIDPVIFADSEDPGRIKTFRRAGYKMREAPKPKGSVVGGIEIVRLKLMPAIGQPELFFLAGDDGVELLVKRIQQYHWETDSAGRITNYPSEEDDDECDALRYLVMNVFAPKGSVKVATEEERNPLALPREQTDEKKLREHHWQQMMQHAGLSGSTSTDPVTGAVDTMPQTKGKRGRFLWDMG